MKQLTVSLTVSRTVSPTVSHGVPLTVSPAVSPSLCLCLAGMEGWGSVCRTQQVHDLLVLLALVSRRQHLAHVAVHGARNVIYVLRLDDRLQVVLQDAREVVLNTRPTPTRLALLPQLNLGLTSKSGTKHQAPACGLPLSSPRLSSRVGAASFCVGRSTSPLELPSPSSLSPPPQHGQSTSRIPTSRRRWVELSRMDGAPHLQLGSTEVGEDFLPVRRVVEHAQVGFELPRQDLQRRGLADPVGAHQTQHLRRQGSLAGGTWGVTHVMSMVWRVGWSVRAVDGGGSSGSVPGLAAAEACDAV
jgi:hypothetical protein